jgi:hypothetical protein
MRGLEGQLELLARPLGAYRVPTGAFEAHVTPLNQSPFCWYKATAHQHPATISDLPLRHDFERRRRRRRRHNVLTSLDSRSPSSVSSASVDSLDYQYLAAKMPPKDKNAGGKKPTASKLVEDKTFGMKNKKGAVAQKQIAQMQASAKAGSSAEQKRKEAEKAAREREKKAAEEAKKEAELLLNKPAQVQKVPFGVDPKTVMCIFFKKGNCEKGKKCKFSHDLEMERKTEKRSLYTDTRQEEEEQKKTETSADWDEDKLRSVVLSKKGNQRTTTDKVCKYFIEAIEDGKYGWFWICPNGGDKCMYKHALPPG